MPTQTLHERIHDVEDFAARWRLLTLDPEQLDRLEFFKGVDNDRAATLEHQLDRYSHLIIALLAVCVFGLPLAFFVGKYGVAAVAWWALGVALDNKCLVAVAGVFVGLGVWATREARRDQ